MKTLQINTQKTYNFYIGENLEKCGDIFCEQIFHQKAFIISDDNVFKIYGKIVQNSFQKKSINTFSFVFRHGESSKTLETVENILNSLAEQKFEKSDVIVALGGGVCSDMAGFAAALYMRGIRWYILPTTLLAALDAAVGGKTAVNSKYGKNLTGVIYQPSGVFFDINTLKTLPRREFSNGLAEAIKCGFIYDKSILNLLENDISETVLRSLKVKKHFLELDEFDTSERRILNFGHTYGHAVEKASDYSVFHGEAVAIGMCAVTMAAEYHKICENGTCEQLKKILAENNLPIKTDIPLKTIVEIMKIDKKSENDSIILILPKKIEKCIQYPIKKDELYDFFRCII